MSWCVFQVALFRLHRVGSRVGERDARSGVSKFNRIGGETARPGVSERRERVTLRGSVAAATLCCGSTGNGSGDVASSSSPPPSIPFRLCGATLGRDQTSEWD